MSLMVTSLQPTGSGPQGLCADPEKRLSEDYFNDAGQQELKNKHQKSQPVLLCSCAPLFPCFTGTTDDGLLGMRAPL